MQELDVLGDQLQLALQFLESGFDNIPLHDAVLGESVRAHALFTQEAEGTKPPSGSCGTSPCPATSP